MSQFDTSFDVALLIPSFYHYFYSHSLPRSLPGSLIPQSLHVVYIFPYAFCLVLFSFLFPEKQHGVELRLIRRHAIKTACLTSWVLHHQAWPHSGFRPSCLKLIHTVPRHALPIDRDGLDLDELQRCNANKKKNPLQVIRLREKNVNYLSI